MDICGKFESIGNTDILSLPKTAFLCSRTISSTAVLKCFDWAIGQRENGNCVMSGFQSKIEKDVLHFLLQGTQPVIIVLARGLQKRLQPDLADAIHQNRLLIITPFERNIQRITTETAGKRNRLMLELADSVVFGSVSKSGELSRIIQEYADKRSFTFL